MPYSGPPGKADISEIYEVMKELEQPHFSALYPGFEAFAHMPDMDTSLLPYPFSFRFPPAWVPSERRMGGENRYDWEIHVAILTDRFQGNIGALTAFAQPLVEAFYDLYDQNSTVGGTVRRLLYGKGFMGRIELFGVEHFGCQLPLIARQYK